MNDVYKLTHEEYLRILRYCLSIHNSHMFGATQQLLIDLLGCNTFSTDGTINIPERLMRRVAIANMCDFSILQYRDSAGDIDYTGLGSFAIDILSNILRTI